MQTLFAGETYHFVMRFDEAVTVVSQDALRFSSNGVELPGLSSGAAVVSQGHEIYFDYTIPVEAVGNVMTITLNREAVQDDMQRTLPEDAVFTRRLESPCGPAYLASLSGDASVCRCRRSDTRCECQCGNLGASMEY